MNRPQLFDAELLQNAREAATAKKDGKAQDRHLSEVTKMVSKEDKASASKIYRFPKQSFQQMGG